MRWLIPLVALLWALTGAPASAGVFLATSPVSSGGGGPCAGDPFPDGCIGAPAPLTAQWAQPSFFTPGGYANTTAATSIDYSGKRPFWKVAGVDYHIGNYTPALSVCTKTVWDGTCLLDPAKPGIMPAGCSYTTGGLAPVGVGIVTCSSATFAHFNMGPVNGHGCTAMRAGNTLTIDDVYLFNDTGQCSTTSVQAWLSNGAGATYNITITNTYLDGNWHNTYPTSPSCPSASCNSSIPFFISGNVLIKYSVVNNWFGRSLTYIASNPAVGFKMQYSYAQCWDYRPWSGHGELFLGSASGATPGDAFAEFDYTTILGCADSNQSLTVTLFPAANAGSYGPTTVSHNVVVLPNIGLPAGTLSVSATGFVDNGAGNGTYNAVPGNIYTITSVTGNTPVGHGAEIPCGGIGGPFTAAGGGFVWQPIVNPSLPAGMQQMTVEGNIIQSSGISIAAATCNGSIASQANGSNGVLSEGAGPAYTIVGNYVDPTALNHSLPLPNWTLAASQRVTATGQIAGNTLTVTTNSPAPVNAFIYATDIAQCTPNYASCPHVTNTGAGNVIPQVSVSSSSAQETLIGYVNEVSIASGTISGIGLTTGSTVTLTAGDFVFDTNIAGCGPVTPDTCPTIVTTATGTHFTLSTPTGTHGPEAMQTVRKASTFTGQISGTNLYIPVATLNGDAIWNASIPGCGPATTQSAAFTCPTVTSASGTGHSVTISTILASPVGPFSVQIGQLGDCAAITVWGTDPGKDPNVDMSGNRSAATENSWNLFNTAPWVGPKC